MKKDGVLGGRLPTGLMGAALVMLAAPLMTGAMRGGQAATLSAQQRPHVRSGPQIAIRTASEGETQRLELADGSRMVGRVVAAGDPVEFELASGSVIMVARESIRALTTVEGQVRDGRFWRKDPSHNRLFFGPTGRTVGKDHGYVAVFEALFPTISIGVHDRVTLGGGALLAGDFTDGHPFWLLPKVNLLTTEQGAVSVGALFARGGDAWARVFYGVGTLGSPDRSVTAGLGLGYLGDERVQAVQVGGAVRVHENLALMTENYVIDFDYDTIGLFGGGVRFIGDRLTADLGVAIPSEDAVILPLVNFVWNW